jgi:hypothetical protein
MPGVYPLFFLEKGERLDDKGIKKGAKKGRWGI